MPKKAQYHRRAANLRPGAHPGGLGPPLRITVLAEAAVARHGRHVERGAAVVGNPPTPPQHPPHVGLGVCPLRSGWRTIHARLESLRRFRTTVVGKVWATVRAEDPVRSREWCAWLEEAWTSNQEAVYRWLKAESSAPPVTFPSWPDGNATADLAENDGLLQDA